MEKDAKSFDLAPVFPPEFGGKLLEVLGDVVTPEQQERINTYEKSAKVEAETSWYGHNVRSLEDIHSSNPTFTPLT